MELHVRELFAGKWMEDKSVDVEDSIENGRSVGIVRVDLHSNLADLRKEIDQQISQDNDMPSRFGFVERLGKQLVEIWEEEEPVLRVKDLVGRETEILIVERPDQNTESRINPQSRKTKKKGKMEMKGRRRQVQREADDEDDDQSYAIAPANAQSRGKRSLAVKKSEGEELYSADESRRGKRSSSRHRATALTTDDQYQVLPLRQQNYRRRSQIPSQNNPAFQRSSRLHSQPRNRQSSEEQDFFDQPVRRNASRGRRKTREIKREWIESDQDSSPQTSDNKLYGALDRQKIEEIEGKRPATVRIRKERSLTEELRFRGDRRPSIKNSIMKKSVSIDNLRSLSSSDGDGDGFATADSGKMDDYFLDRQPFSFSALNLRDMQSQNGPIYRRFEPSKMERRISGLLNRIRDVQEKIDLLKKIGEEHWRGRFYQIRRTVAPLEDRLEELQEEENDIEDNLMGLFELRKPVRNIALFSLHPTKNDGILEAQKIQNQINQLNNQLENIDLDLLKYRKMRDITQNENGNLLRDIKQEKFLRHLLLNRSLDN